MTNDEIIQVLDDITWNGNNRYEKEVMLECRAKSIEALKENDRLKAELDQLKKYSINQKPFTENKIVCRHGYDIMRNELGEELIFCEHMDRWMNIALGECLGNCEAEE